MKRCLGFPCLWVWLLLLSPVAAAQDAGTAVAENATPAPVTDISGGSPKLSQIDGLSYFLTESASLTLTHPRQPIVSGEVHLNSEDAALIFDKVKPSQVHADFVKHLFINGKPAQHGVNARIVAYAGGAIVLPHGPDYQPLTTYNQSGFRGDGLAYHQHTYYRPEQLGGDEDQIASFVLKRGYMATFAENADGTGASQVFIADRGDLRLPAMPEGLRGKVSFVRVFPWRWTAKRGFGGKLEDAQALNSAWRYQWNADGQSTLDMEYVPMRHNGRWPSFEQINALQDVTHLLGFNEPMQEDQAHMTMDQVLNQWPKLQESGLRLGSPCTTDGTIDWLYEFIEKADERGYRVDFVTVHYYKGNWPDEKLIAWLREIHERTGRPLWVTEWNNGAPWVQGHNPTQQENARKITEYCRAMNAQPWIERYAIFNIAGRKVIENDTLTPTGRAYANVQAVEAYVGEKR